ncbi:hypothetical protein FGIG_01456 [Fasciola gigantica]|uniref:Ceramide kinase PH domain-containing protein n=1 Tax=Fasciola gigantica TaxID=46835 RepID=A0A504Z1D8_FASGI|nr:hypothetical protein FGIG_01456 [Fasciola gigantica]
MKDVLFSRLKTLDFTPCLVVLTESEILWKRGVSVSLGEVNRIDLKEVICVISVKQLCCGILPVKMYKVLRKCLSHLKLFRGFGFVVSSILRVDQHKWRTQDDLFWCDSPETTNRWISAINDRTRLANSSRPKKLLICVNPTSGHKKAELIYDGILQPILQFAKVETSLFVTSYRGHLMEHILSHSLEGYDGRNMSENSFNGEQMHSFYYVWSEYALSLRPSELTNMLTNPRVRSATAKTRCNVEVTRRVLNRRELASQWARYSIVRITGPDDQSIGQCNRLLERAVPIYQQRREYPRRAPVTYYSKNVDGHFGMRSGDSSLAALISKNRGGLSCSSKRRSSSESEAGRGLTAPTGETSRSDANSRSEVGPMEPNSYKLTDNEDPGTETSVRVKTHIGVNMRTISGGQSPPPLTGTESGIRIETTVSIESKTDDGGNVMTMAPLQIGRKGTPMITGSPSSTTGSPERTFLSQTTPRRKESAENEPRRSLLIHQPDASSEKAVLPRETQSSDRQGGPIDGDLKARNTSPTFSRMESDTSVVLNQTQSTHGTYDSRAGIPSSEKKFNHVISVTSPTSPHAEVTMHALFDASDHSIDAAGQQNPSKVEPTNSTVATLTMKASCISDSGESAIVAIGITASAQNIARGGSPRAEQDPTSDVDGAWFSNKLPGSQGIVPPAEAEWPPIETLCSPPQPSATQNEDLDSPCSTSKVGGGFSPREMLDSVNPSDGTGGAQLFLSEKTTFEQSTAKLEIACDVTQVDILSSATLAAVVDVPNKTSEECRSVLTKQLTDQNDPYGKDLSVHSVSQKQDDILSSPTLAAVVDVPNKTSGECRSVLTKQLTDQERAYGKDLSVHSVSQKQDDILSSPTLAAVVDVPNKTSGECRSVLTKQLTDQNDPYGKDLSVHSVSQKQDEFPSLDQSEANRHKNLLCEMSEVDGTRSATIPKEISQSLPASSTAMVNFSLRQQIMILDSERAYDLSNGGGIKPLTEVITPGVPATKVSNDLKVCLDASGRMNTLVGEQFAALTPPVGSVIGGSESEAPDVVLQPKNSLSRQTDSYKDFTLLTPQQLLLTEPGASSDLTQLGAAHSPHRLKPVTSSAGHISFPDDSVTPTRTASQQLTSDQPCDFNELDLQESARASFGAQRVFEGSGVPGGSSAYEDQTPAVVGEQQQTGPPTMNPPYPVRGVEDRVSPGAMLSRPTPPPPLSMPSSTSKRMCLTIGQQVSIREASTVAPVESALISPHGVIPGGASPPVTMSGCRTPTTGEGMISFKLTPNQELSHGFELPTGLDDRKTPHTYVAIRTPLEQNRPEDKQQPTPFQSVGYDLVSDGQVVFSVDGSLPALLGSTDPTNAVNKPPPAQRSSASNRQKEFQSTNQPSTDTVPPSAYNGTTTCFTEDVHVWPASSSPLPNPSRKFEVESHTEIQSGLGVPGPKDQSTQYAKQSFILEQSPPSSPFNQIRIERWIDLTTKDPTGSGTMSLGESVMGSPGVSAVGANLTALPQLDQMESPGPAFSHSPLSVTTSISTNLEVHVNRDTGKIDVSFEICGTPAPTTSGGVNSNIPSGQGVSTEWRVKVQQNALFGPVGAMPSAPESLEPDIAHPIS